MTFNTQNFKILVTFKAQNEIFIVDFFDNLGPLCTSAIAGQFFLSLKYILCNFSFFGKNWCGKFGTSFPIWLVPKKSWLITIVNSHVLGLCTRLFCVNEPNEAAQKYTIYTTYLKMPENARAI